MAIIGRTYTKEVGGFYVLCYCIYPNPFKSYFVGKNIPRLVMKIKWAFKLHALKREVDFMYESFKCLHFHLIHAVRELERKEISWWKFHQKKMLRVELECTLQVLHLLMGIKEEDLIEDEKKLSTFEKELEVAVELGKGKLSGLNSLLNYHAYNRDTALYQSAKIENLYEKERIKVASYWLELVKSLS